MKKLFSLFAVLLFAASMNVWGTDVTVTFTFKTDKDITYTASGTSGGGAACEVSKSNVTLQGSNAYTVSSKPLSCYANSTLTITAPGNINNVVLSYNGKVYPFDEVPGTDAKDDNGKFADSGSHSASYAPTAPATSIVLNNSNGGKTELLSLTITYTAAGNISVTGVSLNKKNSAIYVGGAETLTASVAPVNATDKSITWNSSNPSVATVSNGVVSALAVGTTKVSVTTTDGNFSDTCVVTVNEFIPTTSVTLNHTSLELMATKRATLNATVAPDNATNKNVTWTSSDASIVTVANGVIKAVAVGNATITVTTENGSKTATCNVTVTAKIAPQGAVLFETFDNFSGVGGNDGTWSGINSADDFSTHSPDNNGWTVGGSVWEADACACISRTKVNDSYVICGLTSPAIGKAGSGYVQFDAESWGSDGSDFWIEIIGGGTFLPGTDLSDKNIKSTGDTAKIALQKKGIFKTYTLYFTGLTTTSQIHFYSPAGKRAFLDEIAVVVYDDPVLTVGPSGYATYYNSKHAYTMPAGMEGYAWNNGLVKAYDAGQVVPAGVALVLKAEAGIYTLISTTGGTAPAANALLGTDEETVLTADANSYFYGLSLNAAGETNSVGFYWMNATGAAFTNGAHKAYLKLAKSSGAAPRYLFNGENEATAIETIEATEGVQKFIENGQLVIVKDGVRYNALGQTIK